MKNLRRDILEEFVSVAAWGNRLEGATGNSARSILGVLELRVRFTKRHLEEGTCMFCSRPRAIGRIGKKKGKLLTYCEHHREMWLRRYEARQRAKGLTYRRRAA